jgi:predicted nuclease of predicted toxin-antitoxin system
MPRFLVDEDLPRSLARQLRAAGLDTDDVRDVGLRGQPDRAVFAHAVQRQLVLVTGDLGFANLIHFPLGTHAGIVVARFPNETPASDVVEAVVRAVRETPEPDFAGSLIVIEPGRVRLRRRS